MISSLSLIDALISRWLLFAVDLNLKINKTIIWSAKVDLHVNKKYNLTMQLFVWKYLRPKNKRDEKRRVQKLNELV